MPPAPPSRLTPALPVLLAALTCALTLRPVDDLDLWFHLAAGRLIWTTWAVPATNTFAFTTPDHPWVDLHWIFQLMLYACHAIGGPSGCIALAIGLMLTTVAVLYAAARRFAPPVLVTALLAMALMIASLRFVPRPELLGFALLAVFLWLLDDYPRCGRAIYALVPLQILWTNAHGTVPVGILLVTCYWLGATLAFLPLPQGWRTASGCTAREWRRLTIVLVLVTAGSLLNPWGVEGARLPLDLLRMVTGGSSLSSRIGEFRGPFESGYPRPLVYAWLGLLGLAGLSFLVNLRRWHLGRLLAVTAFGALSTQALRNMALFVWVAVPAVTANLGGLLDRPPAPVATARAEKRRTGKRPPASRSIVPLVGEAALIAMLVLLIGAVVTNRYSRFLGVDHEFGVGLGRLHFPSEALRFARTVGIRGRPFHCFAMGGFLTWHLFPSERVFIDGRAQAYPESFFDLYRGTLDTPERWPEIASRYRIDYALLTNYWWDRYPLARYLAIDHGWTLVYYDENTSLFLPLDEAHREVRERAERAFAEIQARRLREPASPVRRSFAVPVTEVYRQTTYGDFLMKAIWRYAEAAAAYERALALDPDVLWTRHSLGVAYWRAGNHSRALLEWRDILRRDPGFEPAKKVLAEAAQQDPSAATLPR